MSEPAPPPPSPSLEALLRHERVPPLQPEAVRARATARALAAPAEMAPAAPRGPGGSGAWVTGVAVGLSVIVGVAVTYRVARPASHSRVVAVTPSAAVLPVPGPSAPVALPPVATENSASDPREGTTHFTAHRGVGSKVELVDEVELLGRAREDDNHGDYAGVLAMVTLHERTHPHGRLLEEREVLRVRALVGLGRVAEARVAAARFRRRFPRSVLLPKMLRTVSEGSCPAP